MNNRRQLEKEIKTIIYNITEIPEEKLDGSSNFVDDLGIESIMAVDMIAEIEEKYEIRIPEEKYSDFTCLDSVVELINSLLKETI